MEPPRQAMFDLPLEVGEKLGPLKEVFGLQGYNDLMVAIIMEDDEKAGALIAADKAQVTHRNHNGYSALHCAVLFASLDLVQLLLDNGARGNLVSQQGECPPLVIAVYRKNSDMLTYVLSQNAFYSAKEWASRIAAEQDKWNFVIILVKKGAYRRRYCGPFETRRCYKEIEEASYQVSGPVLQEEIDLSSHETEILGDYISTFGLRGYNRLMLAIIRGNTDEAQDIIAQDNDKALVTERNEQNYSALHFAILFADLSLIKLLLENGAGVNLISQRGELPALWFAVMRDSTEVFDYLLSRGTPPPSVMTPALRTAVQNGKAECVEKLLRNGAFLDDNEDDPLLKLMSMPLETAENIYALFNKPFSKKRPRRNLNYDERSRFYEFADLNKREDGLRKYNLAFGVTGYNSLMRAIILRNEVDAQAIIAEDTIQVTEKNGKGYTPLHFAALFAPVSLIEQLLANGASSYLKDNPDGQWSPLAIAAFRIDARPTVFEFLLTRCKDRWIMRSALTVAISRGMIELVTILLEEDAHPDPNQPLSLLTRGLPADVRSQIVRLLLVKGRIGQHSFKEEEQKSILPDPLERAAAFGYPSDVEQLLAGPSWVQSRFVPQVVGDYLRPQHTREHLTRALTYARNPGIAELLTKAGAILPSKGTEK